MKTINYVLLLIGMVGFTTCSPKNTDVEPVEKAPVKIWDKTFGGNENDSGESIIQTTDGGFLIIGYSFSDISGDKTEKNRGSADFWVIKINSQGNKIWDKTFGGNSFEIVTSCTATSDGGFAIVGPSSSNISNEKTEKARGYQDYWVIKFDNNGKKIWDKTLGGDIESTNIPSSIISTLDGGLIIGGTSNSKSANEKTENSVYDDLWIVKLDSKGQKIWDKTFGDKNQIEHFISITSTNDEGFIFAGFFNSSPTNTEYKISKINNQGQKLWDKKFTTNRIIGQSPTEKLPIIIYPDGSFILVGNSKIGILGDKTEVNRGKEDIWMIRVNSLGEKIWDKTLGGIENEFPFDVINTSDGGFIISGISYSGISGDKTETSKGEWDYWIVKVNENGQKVWDKTLGGNDLDWSHSIISTSDGGLMVAGVSFSNTSGDKTDVSKGSSDYWLVKLGFQ